MAERWRDKLVAGGNDALAELLNEHPHADRQQLRQLLRNAQKEAEAAKPPKSSRLLYRYLKNLLKVEGENESEDDADFENEDELENE